VNRRDLVTLFGIAVALPHRGFAQQKPLPVIGYFSARSAETETPVRAPFLAALEKAGFVAGRNVTIEYRFAEGRRDRLPTIAAELVGLQPAVLVATEHGAALAAKAATATVPIVFTSGYDSVQAGLVESLNRPGGNATGVNLFTSELGPKRLALLRELLAEPGTIAVLIDPNSPSAPVQIETIEAAARAIGQPLLLLQAGKLDETEKAFATMAERRVAGLLYGASTSFQVVTDRLVALAARHRLPALYEWREFVTAGGLISYSTSRTEFGRQLGEYAGRILKGASPADLPVVQSARFELVINLKTAKTLGLTVPQSILARADEVIE
jgi:putative ABC transport system substrate-binding protein